MMINNMSHISVDLTVVAMTLDCKQCNAELINETVSAWASNPALSETIKLRTKEHVAKFGKEHHSFQIGYILFDSIKNTEIKSYHRYSVDNTTK